MWSILWKIYDFRYLAISTERFYNYYVYIRKSVDRFSIGDVWPGHNVEGTIYRLNESAAEIRAEVLRSRLSSLFRKRRKKKSLFGAKDARDWLVKKKKNRKKIYPSHSGNFCDSVISGIVASNDSTKETKRERLQKRKKKIELYVCPHYDRRTYF